MATGVMTLAGSCVPTRALSSLQQPSYRPTISGKASLGLRPSSPSIAAARALASSSSSCFSGASLAPRRSLGWAVIQRVSAVKVRAGKTALGCTKRSRSRKSLARTSGFRVRLLTPGGRNVLKRRRTKGRKVLCPSSNPSSGKRA